MKHQISSPQIKKADLHVHSKYSDHPSTWGHKVYNSPESFTEVETLYQQAKRRGMDYVTITDHDDIRGCLELRELHPEDTFISCELTTFFPEDGCKIHILVYGITEAQFEQLRQLASSIYSLRDYLFRHNIAHSVAHAAYDQDGLLDFEHIEKLVLLFNVFEILNGACDAQSNIALQHYLQNLNPDQIRTLSLKHQVNYLERAAWQKGFTGGSDDHCGILIGSAYTQCSATSKDQFLEQLKSKQSCGDGMHGSFVTYATGVIKHIHDYRQHRDPKYSGTKMNDFLELFFESDQGNLLKRFKKSQSLRYLKKKNSKTHKALHRLLAQIEHDKDQDMSLKIPATYQQITRLHDEMFGSVVNALAKHLPTGDIFKGLNKLTTVFPMIVLALPFLGSMRHQALKSSLKKPLLKNAGLPYAEKALWVTDTIDDLNGVSVTLRQIANYAVEYGYQLKLVCCVNQDSLREDLPCNSLNLEPIKTIALPGYETQQVGFPSLLKLMQVIHHEKADQIVISTPGPLGLGALLCAKLLDLPVKMIYHTDFGEQITSLTKESSLAMLADHSLNAFYKQADEVFVPSRFYINKLIQSGLDDSRLQIFPRGLDLDLYKPMQGKQAMHTHKFTGDFTLLFAGRISKDKNLNMIKQLQRHYEVVSPNCFNLVIAGDGPDLTDLSTSLAGQANVLLTGRVKAEELVNWYQAADLLIFPSHTDTFGMVVLEAQACGLPCLVTNSGGPKEIIEPGETGDIVYDDSPESWLEAIQTYRQIKASHPIKWKEIQRLCRHHVEQQNNWQLVFDTVLGSACFIKSATTNCATTAKSALLTYNNTDSAPNLDSHAA